MPQNWFVGPRNGMKHTASAPEGRQIIAQDECVRENPCRP
jgi:hypothetical protein